MFFRHWDYQDPLFALRAHSSWRLAVKGVYRELPTANWLKSVAIKLRKI